MTKAGIELLGQNQNTTETPKASRKPESNLPWTTNHSANLGSRVGHQQGLLESQIVPDVLLTEKNASGCQSEDGWRQARRGQVNSVEFKFSQFASRSNVEIFFLAVMAEIFILHAAFIQELSVQLITREDLNFKTFAFGMGMGLGMGTKWSKNYEIY